ncbi:hypothetical protein F5Y06DRAFT_279621 [Hypoxylon sp. FL0890]|nr:hypothetical protein F5Y06DRAFT_279621 [Hypoxylon sp. FL0890]
MPRTKNKKAPHKAVIRPVPGTIENDLELLKDPTYNMDFPEYQRLFKGSMYIDYMDHEQDDDKRISSPFLRLPCELRCEIYKYLLCSPDPIMISPLNRQLHVRPANRLIRRNQNTVLIRTSHGMPYIEILHVCSKINLEATPILYQCNTFFVNVGHWKTMDENIPFLWNLRHSSISSLSSITFVQGCNCENWVAEMNRPKPERIREWTTTGEELAKQCFRCSISRAFYLPTCRDFYQTIIGIFTKVLDDSSGCDFHCPPCEKTITAAWPQLCRGLNGSLSHELSSDESHNGTDCNIDSPGVDSDSGYDTDQSTTSSICDSGR